MGFVGVDAQTPHDVLKHQHTREWMAVRAADSPSAAGVYAARMAGAGKLHGAFTNMRVLAAAERDFSIGSYAKIHGNSSSNAVPVHTANFRDHEQMQQVRLCV